MNLTKLEQDFIVAKLGLEKVADVKTWCTGEDCTAYDDGYDEGRAVAKRIAEDALRAIKGSKDTPTVAAAKDILYAALAGDEKGMRISISILKDSMTTQTSR